jgi:hypothetical protein
MKQRASWLSYSYSVFLLKIGIRKIFKVFLYFIGIAIVEFGLLGFAFSVNVDKTLQAHFAGIAVLLGFLICITSIFVFFRWYYWISPLHLGRYFLWIIGATVGAFAVYGLEDSFFPYSSKAILSSVMLAVVVLIYGGALLVIAHIKPPLHQQIDESVRKILEITPRKQMALTDLIMQLQKVYKCSNENLYQTISELKYLEQINVSDTEMLVCRIKRQKQNLAFPQVITIIDLTVRMNVERALSNLTEDNVDIGLFLLGREFETVLKAFLVVAYGKGMLTSTPGGKNPDQLKLVEMIACLRSNNIVTDDAALSYLRQMRNDRAHGGTPTLVERRLLMNNVQLLANLYIDYIKFFDELIRSLR